LPEFIVRSNSLPSLFVASGAFARNAAMIASSPRVGGRAGDKQRIGFSPAEGCRWIAGWLLWHLSNEQAENH
jgi:hypothetical protein